jgi:hypothetical protein
MKISKEQREGIARSMDTLATSSVVGAVLGATGHSAVTPTEVLSLSALAALLYVLGFFVRSPQ